MKADEVSKRACGYRADGRLYVTTTKSLMLPFFRSAIKFSGLLVNSGSDLMSIFTVKDLQTNSATPPPFLSTLSFQKRLVFKCKCFVCMMLLQKGFGDYDNIKVMSMNVIFDERKMRC